MNVAKTVNIFKAVKKGQENKKTAKTAKRRKKKINKVIYFIYLLVCKPSYGLELGDHRTHPKKKGVAKIATPNFFLQFISNSN